MAARSGLGGSAFDCAWHVGASMAPEQVKAEVRAVLAGASGAADAPAPTDPAAGHGLTAREAEVLRLVVEGRSDREIGEALFISPRTVMRHMTAILAKLGVENRTAAAGLAVRRGLV